MSTKPSIISTAVTGLLSAAIFLVMVVSGLGFLFMFLSLLPLLFAGLGKSPSLALHGCFVATALIMLISAELSVGMVFLFFFGLPSWYFTRMARLSFIYDGNTAWYPVGNIITHLSLYACVIICAVVLYYTSEPGGITAVLSQKIQAAFSDMPEEYGKMASLMASNLSFLVFAMLAWLWAIALYAHAWLANMLLSRQHKEIRPDLAVELFHMPGWMLYLLIVAALASIIGSVSMSFAGSACFITLLLPYFFLGLALTHRTSKNWPNRGFFLFFIYFMVASQVWVALLLAAVGCVYQIRELNKRLSSGRISPK